MDDKYSALSKQLQCLGYLHAFPPEAFDLVQSLTSDLVQTTYSLQHYINLSKETIQQKDLLTASVEPYKSENYKLIKENSNIHSELAKCKQEFAKKSNELYLRIRELESELLLAQDQNRKLKDQFRDLQLRQIGAQTISSSKKSINKAQNVKSDVQICHKCLDFKSQLEEQLHNLNVCKNERSTFIDKIVFMKSELDNKDKELERLMNSLDGRPLSDSNRLERINLNLKSQLKDALAKQHEAMSRAVQLADNNQTLKSLLKSTDETALKLEQECNARLRDKQSIIVLLQNQIESLTKQCNRPVVSHDKCLADLETKQNEIHALHKVLEDLNQKRNDSETINKCQCLDSVQKQDLLNLLQRERNYYEKHINEIKSKLKDSNENLYTKEYDLMKDKIKSLEQHIFRLDKENCVLLDKNMELKSQLERLNCENSFRSVERDLDHANREIKRLESERSNMLDKLKTFEADENYKLKEKLKALESELLHSKSMYNQLKSLQNEADKNVTDTQTRWYETKKELSALKTDYCMLEKLKNDLEHEMKAMQSDKLSLRDNLNQIDRDRDKLIMDVDDKSEKIASLEHNLRSKNTNIELLENKITELSKKLELLSKDNAVLEHKCKDTQSCNETLSLELDTVTKQRDNNLIENRRLQSDLAAVTNDLRTSKREYEQSRKEVEEMKQQLQHYVDEVRRVEDILSRKEAERTEMLDHFASLSHEATVLETNNHSLESEAVSKTYQLQSAAEKVEDLERKLKSRESIVEMQEEKISNLMYKLSVFESDLNKQRDVNKNLDQMLDCVKDNSKALENHKKDLLVKIKEADLENERLICDLKMLKKEKRGLEDSLIREKANVESLEALLSESRRETVKLKLNLESVLDENRKLKSKADTIRRLESESLSNRQKNEEAAKHLQELQLQMTDERYQRVTGGCLRLNTL